MRRIRSGPAIRCTLGLVALVSLVLCTGAVITWVRSHWTKDVIGWGRKEGHTFGVATSRGKVLLCLGLESAGSPRRLHVVGFHRYAAPPRKLDARDDLDHWLVQTSGDDIHGWPPGVPLPPTHRTSFDVAGFAYQVGFAMPMTAALAGPSIGIRYRALLVPLWAVAALAALPGTIVIAVAARRQARRCAGRCPICGYDLRQSPDRCPECGATVARSTGRRAI